jgi:hypothetical protein
VIALAVVGSLIALAAVGRDGLSGAGIAGVAGHTEAAIAAPLPTTPVTVRPPAVGRVEGGTGGAPVTLRIPAVPDALITGATVTIDGELAVHASSLRIALEVNRLHRLEVVTVDTTDPDGALRPDRTPTFHVELSLPAPRPNGRVWVVITALDRSGHAICTMRESVMIGASLFRD